VLAAVEDIAKCFWIDRSKVVIAGYSSGGQLAYRVGLKHADQFAGILIENSGLYAAGDTPETLTANAAWKINIAHSAHTGDTVFPIAKVEASWTTIRNAGLPLKTQEVAGTHDGVGSEWSNWLIPASVGWTKP
jgi:predicted esterase